MSIMSCDSNYAKCVCNYIQNLTHSIQRVPLHSNNFIHTYIYFTCNIPICKILIFLEKKTMYCIKC